MDAKESDPTDECKLQQEFLVIVLTYEVCGRHVVHYLEKEGGQRGVARLKSGRGKWPKSRKEFILR